MRVDVIARAFGDERGGPNGMAIAAGYLAHTLERLGHVVRRLSVVDGFGADLVITTVQPHWRRTAALAVKELAQDRLVYWHHAAGVPEGHGCTLAAPPAVAPTAGWVRHLVLPPSSWAAENPCESTREAVIVGGAGPAKGGHVALAAARLLPALRWYVIRSRSSAQDRQAWQSIPGAEVAPGVVPPTAFLSRARAVLAPTRFEVHPLLLVEAAAWGIPIVCTDMPETRAAAGCGAVYVPMNAPADDWAAALRDVLVNPPPRLSLRTYAEIVSAFLSDLQARAAA